MNSEVEDEEEKAVDKKKGKKKQPPQELVEKPYEIEDIEDDYKDEFDEWFFYLPNQNHEFYILYFSHSLKYTKEDSNHSNAKASI